jgi:hypothetical protein
MLTYRTRINVQQDKQCPQSLRLWYLRCSVGNQRDSGNLGNHHGNKKNNCNLSTMVIVLTAVSTSQTTGNQGNHGNNTINGNLRTKFTVIKLSTSIAKH